MPLWSIWSDTVYFEPLCIGSTYLKIIGIIVKGCSKLRRDFGHFNRVGNVTDYRDF